MLSREQSAELKHWIDFGWARNAAAPNWGETVIKLVVKRLRTGDQLGNPVTLISSELASFAGVPTIEFVYSHAYLLRGTAGLRVRIDVPPLDGAWYLSAGDEVAEKFADYLCFLMEDPPGTSQAEFIEDRNGAWWWGYGYPYPGVDSQ